MSLDFRRPCVVVLLLIAAALGGAFAAGADRGRTMASRIIFPQQGRSIRMDHATPEHRALRCEVCHQGASRSDRASDRLMPAEESCLPCHEAEVRREPPQGERCARCHVGDVPASTYEPPRLRFSHARHARAQVSCLECHVGIDVRATSTGPHLPRMRQCFECHESRDPAVSTECTTCHLTLPDGRMRSRYPEGWLNPPAWLFGMRHDPDWLVRHRWVAADSGSLCAECHAERDCADCHDGRVRSPRVHPNDYLLIHAQMARRDDPDCASCHQPQQFCGECHARLGLATFSAPTVLSPNRYHPPPEVWIRGPVLHGREAQRAMTTCTSCHAERDCVACHGVLGIGAGVSPHPPGFVTNCSHVLRQNDRSCRLCHGDLTEIAARCRE